MRATADSCVRNLWIDSALARKLPRGLRRRSSLRVIYGQLATIHTANVKLADNLWEHTARIRPLRIDEGIRIWCNGVELPTAIISDPFTFHCKDNQQGSVSGHSKPVTNGRN
jgi:hypothetical protein